MSEFRLFKVIDSKVSESRVDIFDVLRSLAILLIVIGHLGFSVFSSIYPPGKVGVSIFIILSGMALEYVYGSRNIDVGNFYWRRLLRIYPTYFLALILAAFILGKQSLPSNIFEGLLTFTGLCAFAGKWGCSLVETSWFIGLIMSLYLFYPYLSKWTKQSPYTMIGTLFFANLVSNFMVTKVVPLPNQPLDWFPFCRIFEFGLGIFLVRQQTVRSVLDNFRLPMLRTSVRYTSDLSLPVFLIHFPLISTIPFWKSFGGTFGGLAAYSCLTVILSHILLSIDRFIQQKIKELPNPHRATSLNT